MAYQLISTNVTSTVSKTTGRLDKIVVMNAGTTWRLQVFDNSAGSGAMIADLNPPIVGGNYDFGLEAGFSNGLTFLSSGTTPGVITVTWAG